MKKRSFIATIALLLVIALVAPSTSVLAAKKVALNKKKATIQVGQNLTLKLKNNKKKITWKTSKKAVATVSKKGVVKAKKVGKATITAKAGGKTYKCKITVKKATPAAPKATPLTQLGKNPYVHKFTSYIGDIDVNGETKSLYVVIPVTVTASVGYYSTGTKLGDYVGNAKYAISVMGRVNTPTQAYYYDDVADKEVYVAIPADKQEAVNEAVNNYLDKEKKYDLRINFRKDDYSETHYYYGNTAVTDSDFEGYVCTYTNDGKGIFTYTITDVSIFCQYNCFRVSIDD